MGETGEEPSTLASFSSFIMRYQKTFESFGIVEVSRVVICYGIG
jgi:hypothetical protein